MKWGVRKAVERGNDRALSRQYARAQKKLAKLERRSASGKKDAKRAAALGAGAALAGGAAVAGTEGISRGMAKGAGLIMRGSNKAGTALMNVRGNSQVAHKLRNTGVALKRVGEHGGAFHKGAAEAAGAVSKWGNSKSAVGQAIKTGGRKFQNANSEFVAKVTGGKGIVNTTDKFGNLTKGTVARIGAGAIGAGLAGAAGYNAYRAATTKRAAKKAAQFRSEMNKAFAGTKYANAPRTPQKKRRR